MVKRKSKDDIEVDEKISDEEVHYHYHKNGRRSDRGKDNDIKGSVHHHYYYEPPGKKKEKSSKPGIVGGLLIITAICGILTGSIGLFFGAFVGDIPDIIERFSGDDRGDIYGRVTSVNETPLENVTISIEGENLITTTDSEGFYILFNVPIGKRNIIVELEGYNTIIEETFVDPADQANNFHSEWSQNDRTNEHNYVLTRGNEVIEKSSYPPFEWMQDAMMVCSVIIILFSIITVFGGVFALQRKNFPVVVLASILGIFTIGFIIGSILAIIALFIVILAKDEFD